MTEPMPLNSLTAPSADAMFPTLTPAQAARIAAYGLVRQIRKGEVLFEPGDQGVSFFVIRTGEVTIVRPTGGTETPVTTLGPGQFTGEVNMLSGRRTFVRARATEASAVLELNPEHVLARVHDDRELG